MRAVGIAAERDEVAARFWANVKVRDFCECWEWQRAKNHNGYGTTSIGNRTFRAHRVSFWLSGEAIDGVHVLHHCDNPACVNPAHLYAGTKSDNMKDAYSRGRKSNEGENNPRAKLTAEDVSEIRALLRESHFTQVDIGARYGVAAQTVSDIATGRGWSGVDTDQGEEDGTR